MPNLTKQANSYELELHRALIGRVESALEEVDEVLSYSTVRPHKRVLPDAMNGKLRAAESSLEGVRESLEAALHSLEAERIGAEEVPA